MRQHLQVELHSPFYSQSTMKTIYSRATINTRYSRAAVSSLYRQSAIGDSHGRSAMDGLEAYEGLVTSTLLPRSREKTMASRSVRLGGVVRCRLPSSSRSSPPSRAPPPSPPRGGEGRVRGARWGYKLERATAGRACAAGGGALPISKVGAAPSPRPSPSCEGEGAKRC